MNALLPFVILGITAGSVYGLTGTGLVLTYKTSGIFNFAQGAVATTGAYIFYILHDDVFHLPAVPTALICVFVVGPVLDFRFSGHVYSVNTAAAATLLLVLALLNLDHLVLVEVFLVAGYFFANLCQSALGGWLATAIQAHA